MGSMSPVRQQLLNPGNNIWTRRKRGGPVRVLTHPGPPPYVWRDRYAPPTRVTLPAPPMSPDRPAGLGPLPSIDVFW